MLAREKERRAWKQREQVGKALVVPGGRLRQDGGRGCQGGEVVGQGFAAFFLRQRRRTARALRD